MPAPVVLFTYNRPNHLRLAIESLQRNHLATDTDIIIYSDAAKSRKQQADVKSVRDYICTINGFRSVTVIERDENWGLARSIIDGVSTVINRFGRVIVIEDDLVTSPHFLRYMNDGLDFYSNNQDVASIHGYVYPIVGLPNTFFLRGADCWGWATWKDRWQLFEADGSTLLQQLIEKNLLNRFDFNGAYSFSEMLKKQIAGQNNSWAIRWHASMFLLNKLTLYPGRTLVKNIGNDGSGIHNGNTELYAAEVNDTVIEFQHIPIEESEQAFMEFERFFRQGLLTLSQKVIAKIKAQLLRWVS